MSALPSCPPPLPLAAQAAWLVQNSLSATLIRTVRVIDSRSDVMRQPGPHPKTRTRPPRDGRLPPDSEAIPDLPVAVVGVVRVAAAGLRQAAGDHVANGEDGGVEPDLPGAVAARVRCVDDGPGDEDAGQDGDVGEELGRLERGLCLGARDAGWCGAASRRRGCRGRSRRRVRECSCCSPGSEWITGRPPMRFAVREASRTLSGERE